MFEYTQFLLRMVLAAGLLGGCLEAGQDSEDPDGAASEPDSFVEDTPVDDDDATDIIVENLSEQAESSVALPAAAAERDLFDWKINITGTLRGRDMTSSDGHFCQRYRSDSPTNPRVPPFTVKIQLIRNRQFLPDVRYSTATFKNDGILHRACWDFHDPRATYHFQYTVGAIGYRLRAHGTVYH